MPDREPGVPMAPTPHAPVQNVAIPNLTDEAVSVEALPPDLADLNPVKPDLPSVGAEAFARDDHAPKDVYELLRETKAPCGMQRVTWTWPKGPLKGLAVSAFCSEPVCATNGGVCGGPRFVPHREQWTLPDAQDPRARPRDIQIPEIMAASEAAGRRAALITGVPDTRTEKQRAHDIGVVYQHLARAKAERKGWGL